MEMLNAAGVLSCTVSAHVDFELMVESVIVLVSRRAVSRDLHRYTGTPFVEA